MSKRDIAKTQIDLLPDSAVEKVVEFISFQLFSLGLVTNDTTFNKNPNTWSELDTIISQMDVLPSLDDYPRCDIGRDIVDLAGV